MLTSGIVMALVAIVFFIVGSALVSGSEVAFFSLTSNDVKDLQAEESPAGKRILQLLAQPRYLLATILILNNLFNVSIVIVSYFVISQFFDFSLHPVAGFLVNVIGVTLLLVLFGEVMPKVYATQNNRRLASIMALPLMLTLRLFRPLSALLVTSTRFIERKFARYNQNGLSLEELDHAIDITVDPKTSKDEIRILKGIVRFGNITVTQIMCSRVDMVAVDADFPFDDLMETVRDSGFSRIPVYRENLDNIEGVLYVKDLLSHLNKPAGFDWQTLKRPPFFVPETKKIDDLLAEMKENRIHLAIVVDEYGGTSGLVTLEDILEEIIGEIQDEFDEGEEISYQKIDPNNYIFEGKSLIHDVCKVMGLDTDIFDEVKGDADSLAGLVLEIAKKIPGKNDKVRYQHFLFTVQEVEKHRLDKVKVTILKPEPQEKDY